MPTVQIRNPENIALLSADLQLRYEPNFAWVNAISAGLMLPALRAFWPMSSADESGNALDLSGQGRTLSYNGNPAYSAVGLAPFLNLDGAGDYLSRADEAGLDITGTETTVGAALRGLTILGWFEADAFGAAAGLMGKWAAAGNRSYLLYKLAADTPRFSVSGDGTAEVAVTAASAMTAAWYCIAGRFTPSTELALFVNGVKTTNLAGVPASIYSGNASFTIGGYDSPVANFLDGRPSLCALCAAALPDCFVNAFYEQTRALYGV